MVGEEGDELWLESEGKSTRQRQGIGSGPGSRHRTRPANRDEASLVMAI